jgi:biotin carboxyl carrier protein
LLVVVTYLFWYQTWFGRRLSNQEMGEYLTDTSVPHKTQHALAQMGERMTQGDESVKRWYPQVLALARSPQPQFRLTAAWVMGQDSSSAGFHQALRDLLHDGEPAVRLNAALALVRFRDMAAEPELRLMLRPYTLRAPRAGAVKFLMKRGDAVSTSSIVARIEAASGESEDVSAPLAGQIQDMIVPERATVVRDGPLMVLSPGVDQVWECLRGLYFVGEAQDVEDIQSFVRSTPRLPERVKQQAEITVQAIRSRTTLQQTRR